MKTNRNAQSDNWYEKNEELSFGELWEQRTDSGNTEQSTTEIELGAADLTALIEVQK